MQLTYAEKFILEKAVKMDAICSVQQKFTTRQSLDTFVLKNFRRCSYKFETENTIGFRFFMMSVICMVLRPVTRANFDWKIPCVVNAPIALSKNKWHDFIGLLLSRRSTDCPGARRVTLRIHNSHEEDEKPIPKNLTIPNPKETFKKQLPSRRCIHILTLYRVAL